MKMFKAGTPPEEARMLTALCFQAIASGWPIAHAKSGPLGMDGKPQVQLDVKSMMAEAADLATMLTQAVDERLTDDLGRVIPTGPPPMGGGVSGEGL